MHPRAFPPLQADPLVEKKGQAVTAGLLDEQEHKRTTRLGKAVAGRALSHHLSLHVSLHYGVRAFRFL